MNLVFREDRAAQAAAFLIKLHRERFRKQWMRYIRLIKLMYFADRDSLLHLGHLITYDRLVSMDNGPVLSHVYNLLKGDVPRGQDAYWSKHISKPRLYWVRLLKDPGTDSLSPAEERILRNVHERYARYNWRNLIDLSHDLPEWRDPQGSALTINPRDILIAENTSATQADEIIADMVAGSSLF